jgi:hypothetical protein
VTLVSDSVASSNLQHEALELRLATELRAVRAQRAALELEVLNSRDFAIGQAAYIGQLRYQLVQQAAMYERRLDDAIVHDTNHREHIARLEDSLRDVTRRAAHTDALQHQLAALRASTTWRLGRALMLPVRMAKRLLRRG